MTTSCAAPGCEKQPAVRVKTVPLCDSHARLVMAGAGTRGTSVIGLVTQEVQALLLAPATTPVAQAAST